MPPLAEHGLAGVRAVRSARKAAAPFPALKPETVPLGSNILTDH